MSRFLQKLPKIKSFWQSFVIEEVSFIVYFDTVMELKSKKATYKVVSCCFVSFILCINEQNRVTAEVINQSIKPAIDRAIDRSINRSIDQSINRSIDQSINRSINQSINQSVSQSISRSIDRSINCLIGPFSQSVNRKVTRLVNIFADFVISYRFVTN